MSNPLRLPTTHPSVAVTTRPVRRWISVSMLAVGLGVLVLAVPITQQRLLQWQAIGSAGGSVVYQGQAQPGSNVQVNLLHSSPGPTLVADPDGWWSIEQRADEPATTVIADGQKLDARRFAVGHDVFPLDVLYLPAFGALLLIGRAGVPLIERIRHRQLLRARAQGS